MHVRVHVHTSHVHIMNERERIFTTATFCVLVATLVYNESANHSKFCSGQMLHDCRSVTELPIL